MNVWYQHNSKYDGWYLNYFCDKLFIVHAYRTRTGLRIPIYQYLYLLTGRYGGPKKIILCACPQKISCGAVATLTVQINTNNTVLTDIVCLLTTATTELLVVQETIILEMPFCGSPAQAYLQTCLKGLI